MNHRLNGRNLLESACCHPDSFTSPFRSRWQHRVVQRSPCRAPSSMGGSRATSPPLSRIRPRFLVCAALTAAHDDRFMARMPRDAERHHPSLFPCLVPARQGMGATCHAWKEMPRFMQLHGHCFRQLSVEGHSPIPISSHCRYMYAFELLRRRCVSASLRWKQASSTISMQASEVHDEQRIPWNTAAPG